MSLIALGIVNAALDLVVNKGRDRAAEKLKDGDVIDQKFRGLIVSEIDNIGSKLDGVVRKDLKACVSYFQEGIELLHEVFENTTSPGDHAPALTQKVIGAVQRPPGCTKTLADKIRMAEITDDGQSANRMFTNAKNRFKDARKKATEAFANDALELPDRVLAMQFRAMATILEVVDNPSDALAACRVCLKELHDLPAVKECFSVQLKKGFKSWFSTNERKAIISTVCQLNRAIYDITLMVAGRRDVWLLPPVNVAGRDVNPLFDATIAEVLRERGVKDCRIKPWSFAGKDDVCGRRKELSTVASNTNGQFVVTESNNDRVMVFNSSGNYVCSFCPQIDETHMSLEVVDIATDRNGNAFVLVEHKGKPNCVEVQSGLQGEIQVFRAVDGPSPRPVRKIHIRNFRGRLSGCEGTLMTWFNRFCYVTGNVLDVYKIDGKYIGGFAFQEPELINPKDVITGPDSLVRVLGVHGLSVWVFTMKGEQHSKFFLNSKGERMAFHPDGEHIVVAGKECKTNGCERLHVEVYCKNGEYKRKIELSDVELNWIRGITVTMQGDIAVIIQNMHGIGRVIVL